MRCGACIGIFGGAGDHLSRIADGKPGGYYFTVWATQADGTGAYSTAWQAFVNGLPVAGNPDIYDKLRATLLEATPVA